MRIFVINLKRDADKREFMLSQSAKFGLSIEFIEGVDGRALDERFLAENVADYPHCALTKGVIGCSLSHIKTYNKIVRENIPSALVLEDDAVLNERLRDILDKIEAFDKNERAEVYLLSSHYYKKSPLCRLTDHYSLHPFIDGSHGFAYIVNQKAAQILAEELMPVRWEADKWYYFQQTGLVRANCVVPHVLHVEDGVGGTELHRERKPLIRARRRYIDKNLRNLVPLRQQFKKLLWKIFARPFLKKS